MDEALGQFWTLGFTEFLLCYFSKALTESIYAWKHLWGSWSIIILYDKYFYCEQFLNSQQFNKLYSLQNTDAHSDQNF